MRLLLALALVIVGVGGSSTPIRAQTPDTSDDAMAEQPPVVSADVEPTPWSAWWWPVGGAGPLLFVRNGPLEKYDRYVAAATGDNPGTRDWERQNMSFPAPPWAGHCNGAAAAALVEPEPTEPVTLLGITFSVADLKGLLVDYHFGDTAKWSFGENGDLDPADFQRMLLDWVAARHTGFVLTFDLGGGEVWSYPLTRFESEWSPDPGEVGVWHVTTTVWMADTDVPTSFVGVRPYPSALGKTFTYDVTGDPLHPDGGVWTGDSESGRLAHPDRIWYPDVRVRNDRQLVSPELDYRMITTIEAAIRAQSEPPPGS